MKHYTRMCWGNAGNNFHNLTKFVTITNLAYSERQKRIFSKYILTNYSRTISPRITTRFKPDHRYVRIQIVRNRTQSNTRIIQDRKIRNKFERVSTHCFYKLYYLRKNNKLHDKKTSTRSGIREKVLKKIFCLVRMVAAFVQSKEAIPREKRNYSTGRFGSSTARDK